MPSVVDIANGEQISIAELMRLIRALRSASPMAPWEENTYFQDPVQGSIGSAQTNVKLFSGDPQTVGVFFSLSSTAGGQAQINYQSPAANGWLLAVGAPTKDFYQSLHGVIVQKDWFGTTAASQGITWTILKLREWPKPEKQ